MRRKSQIRVHLHKTSTMSCHRLRGQNSHSHGHRNPSQLPLSSAIAACRGHGCIRPRAGEWSGPVCVVAVWIATGISAGLNALAGWNLRHRSGEAAPLRLCRAPRTSPRAGEASHSGRCPVPREHVALRRCRLPQAWRCLVVLRPPGHAGARSDPPPHRFAPLLLRSIATKRHLQLSSQEHSFSHYAKLRFHRSHGPFFAFHQTFIYRRFE